MSALSSDSEAEPGPSHSILNDEVANFSWGPGLEGESVDNSPVS